MADVFISYAHEDVKTATRLAELFKSWGFSVWWDPDLRNAQRYAAVIDRELRRAEAVVVLWTRASVESAWVAAEADKAKNRLVHLRAEGLEPGDVPLRGTGSSTTTSRGGTEPPTTDGWRRCITRSTASLTSRFLLRSPHRCRPPPSRPRRNRPRPNRLRRRAGESAVAAVLAVGLLALAVVGLWALLRDGGGTTATTSTTTLAPTETSSVPSTSGAPATSGPPATSGAPTSGGGTQQSGGGGTATTADTVLKNTSKGEHVVDLQNLLIKANYDPGTVDGRFGAQTDTALRMFETEHADEGAVADGIVVVDGSEWGLLERDAGTGLCRLTAPSSVSFGADTETKTVSLQADCTGAAKLTISSVSVKTGTFFTIPANPDCAHGCALAVTFEGGANRRVADQLLIAHDGKGPTTVNLAGGSLPVFTIVPPVETDPGKIST